MNYEELMHKAIEASKQAYCPYSKFPVGACILTESGNTYIGCNYENSSFGMTICAERNAIGTAIVNGDKKVKAVAIYSPNQDNCTPCGACRQVLHEFCNYDNDMDIIVKIGNELKVYTLAELLPESFSL
ncbi:MAG: cytidine deaminase [Cyanobacteria bacterium SIG26]|nr:cytidine deaminase [Cyanobacteria bacterium SIG26]